MPVRDPKEVFLMVLSNVRRGTEASTKLYEELGDLAKDEEIKELLNTRAFISEGILKRLDECLRMLPAGYSGGSIQSKSKGGYERCQISFW